MNEGRLSFWVAAAEIISAFAVVVSLIYVGLEIRQSSLVSEADNVETHLLEGSGCRSWLGAGG